MTYPNDTGESPVERRLHQYQGCNGLVWRWFIKGDAVPFAFRSEAEALASLQSRPRPPSTERRQS